MIVPLLLLLASLLGLFATLTLPGMGDAVLLAGPCVIASLILLVRARVRAADISDVMRPARGLRKKSGGERYILIDGSNVLHWKDNTPQIETLRAVLQEVTVRGYTPGVVFDANAGYLITGRYQHDRALGVLIGLPEDRVMVVQKGEPADPVLLAAATDLGARIVTNDRYRDWAEAYPKVREPGFLIRGAYRDDRLWLDLEEPARA